MARKAKIKRMFIAGDLAHDKDAMKQLYKWKIDKKWKIEFQDEDEIYYAERCRFCDTRKAMRRCLMESQVFVLIVGRHTLEDTRGSCPTCPSYNHYLKSCKRFRTEDNRTFIQMGCDIAIRGEKKVIVLYKDTRVDKTKCPEALRDVGAHVAMVYRGQDKRKYWKYDAVNEVLNAPDPKKRQNKESTEQNKS